MSIEHVRHLDQTIAIIIRAEYRAEGIEFFTPHVFSQQLAYMNRPAGYKIEPHVHNPVRRDVVWTQEVLLIRSGRVRVDFFTDGKHYLESRVLVAGDVVLLAAGGHGFEMLEPTEMIEVKQGPYRGDEDKTRFEPVEAEEVRIEGAPQLAQVVSADRDQSGLPQTASAESSPRRHALPAKPR